MKITKTVLQKIIKEEMAEVLKESIADEFALDADSDMAAMLKAREEASGETRGNPNKPWDALFPPSSAGRAAAGGIQEVSPDELEEFSAAGPGTYGVNKVTPAELAMAYAADFLKNHRALGMYHNNIWFEDRDGKIYKIGRLG
jgi:hypothetical protein